MQPFLFIMTSLKTFFTAIYFCNDAAASFLTTERVWKLFSIALNRNQTIASITFFINCNQLDFDEVNNCL